MSAATWDPTKLHFEFPVADREVRFKELILYVSHECLDDPTFSRTKLLKILFFSDSKLLGDTANRLPECHIRNCPTVQRQLCSHSYKRRCCVTGSFA